MLGVEKAIGLEEEPGGENKAFAIGLELRVELGAEKAIEEEPGGAEKAIAIEEEKRGAETAIAIKEEPAGENNLSIRNRRRAWSRARS